MQCNCNPHEAGYSESWVGDAWGWMSILNTGLKLVVRTPAHTAKSAELRSEQ